MLSTFILSLHTFYKTFINQIYPPPYIYPPANPSCSDNNPNHSEYLKNQLTFSELLRIFQAKTHPQSNPTSSMQTPLTLAWVLLGGKLSRLKSKKRIQIRQLSMVQALLTFFINLQAPFPQNLFKLLPPEVKFPMAGKIQGLFPMVKNSSTISNYSDY